jgi:hypothetical protein
MPITKNVGSLFVKGMYKDAIWAQTGFQTNRTFCAMFGVNVENLSISYGYKSSNSKFKTITNASHEVTFAFKITETPAILKRLFLPRM